MKRVHTQYFIAIAAIVFLLCPSQGAPRDNAATPEPSGMSFTLLQIQADIQESLDDIASNAENAALSFSDAGLTGAKAQEILGQILQFNPCLVEAVTFSKDGKILAAECKGCQGAVGADISSQEHIAHVLKYKTPTLSGQFLTVEGFNATTLVHPVFSPKGEFLGGISVPFKAEEMLGSLVAPWLNGTDYSIFVMLTDGLDMYSSDPKQIGNNLLTDPLYKPFPGFIAVAERMVKERSGYGRYDFQVNASDDTVVTKEIYWTTAELYGRDWRLALYRIIK